jgi:hypothetical protein
MTGERTGPLSPIRFTFAYAGHGWAHASVSDGVTTYAMDPSYVPQDPLFLLLAAMDKVLSYGGEAVCTWDYESTADRWCLRRAGDTLHITIRREGDAFTRRDWPADHGDLCFATTCDLWKFAAKLRTAISRLRPVEDTYHDPTWVQRTPEYRVLCAYLDEHKRARRSPSPKSEGDDHATGCVKS